MGTLTHKIRKFKAAVLVLALTLSALGIMAQPTIQVTNYTACPNQPVTVSLTWNNVSNASYFLTTPPGGYLPNTGSLGFANTFTVVGSTNSNTCVTFTVSGSGTYNNAPINTSTVFNLCIVPPAPLTITNNVWYCAGQTAVIIAPIGGTSYDLTGPVNLTNLSSNIITIPNISAAQNGNYTVTSIGSCTAYGTTSISVAPNVPLTVNASSNVCQNSPVVLSASLNLGVNFQWYNAVNQNIANTSSLLIASAQPTDAGIMTATAEYPWGNVNCPRTATTQINVVQTSPVSAAASPAGILCQGQKLSFSAVAGGAIGWSWTGPQAFAASISNPTINPVAPVHSGNYTVVALFTNNIITCNTSAVVNVSVVTVNQPVITMPASVCESVTATFTATAPNALNISWFGPNSFAAGNNGTVSIVSIPSVQPNGSGIYYATALFGISSTTCASSSSAQLNVVPVNSVTVIPPTPVCQPNNGYLQSSAIGANQYIWKGPNGFIAPGPNTTVYYPGINASGIYTVTAAFNGGNVTCYNTNTVQLTVYPILTFSLISRQQVCYNTPLGVTGPSGATSYTWTSSTGYVSNSKDINFPSVQPQNSGTYTLNVSLGPCVTSASTTIEVLTPIQFTLVPQSRTLCKGDTTVLEAGVTGGSQNYAYVWNPAVYFENPVGPKKTAVPLGSVIYNVIAHDIACPNYTVGQSFSVNVNQPPVPDLQLDRTAGCVPLCGFFNSKTQSTSAITTYDFGGFRKMQRDSFNYCLDVPGTYTLNIYTKGKNGCSGSYRFPYPLTVFPKPESEIHWSPEFPTTTDEVTFSHTTVHGPELYMQWSFAGGVPTVIDTSLDLTVAGSDTSAAQYPVRKYETIGKYPVMLITRNDLECTDTVVRYLVITDDFRMFIPNTFTPNGDGLNDSFGVKGTGIKIEGFAMEITDRWGNVVFFTRDINEWWDGKFKGQYVTDNTFIYKIRAVGMNGEGRKDFIGYVNAIK